MHSSLAAHCWLAAVELASHHIFRQFSFKSQGQMTNTRTSSSNQRELAHQISTMGFL